MGLPSSCPWRRTFAAGERANQTSKIGPAIEGCTAILLAEDAMVTGGSRWLTSVLAVL